MFQRVKTLTSIGRFNNIRHKTLPSRCGREVCNCLMRLDLKDKKDIKKYYNCYNEWYDYSMRNLIEIN